MPSLSELQREFAAALFGRTEGRAPDWIDSAGMSAAARLQIYRNNTWHNYREALRAVYPVAERLVGEEFFRYAADGYIGSHPSRHGDLHAYGGRFPGFLRRLPQAAGLPYLHYVARLEWLMHESFHASAVPQRLTFEGLSRLLAEAGCALRLILHPSCRLLSAPYPVQRIWLANQPQSDGSADIATGAVRLLIRRRRGVVQFEPLSAGRYALLAYCRRGAPLTRGVEAALAAEPEFDFATALRQGIADATFVDVMKK